MLPPGMAPPGELEDGLDGVLLPGDPGGAPEGELCGEPGIPPLGVLGMPGLTAYVGLLDIGQPNPGDFLGFYKDDAADKCDSSKYLLCFFRV